MSEEIIVNTVLLAEVVDHIQEGFVCLHLVFVHVNTLDIFAELDGSVNLDLFVSRSAFRTYLLRHRSVKGRL